MARVPDHLLRDWIAGIIDVAESRDVDPTVAAELRLLAARAGGFLTEAPHGGNDKRRGLGRGLEALIPTDPETIATIDELRKRLRRIAESVQPPETGATERAAHG